MANKITCTCGHSWDKSDSSKKDATVCHICGKNNMKNGGWLDAYDNKEMQLGGDVYPVNYVPQAQLGTHMLPIDPAQAAGNFFEMLSAPQKALTALFSGKYQSPSEAMGIDNPWGAFAVDAVLDPVNLVGAGLSKIGSKASKAAATSPRTTQDIIKSIVEKDKPWLSRKNAPKTSKTDIAEKIAAKKELASFPGNINKQSLYEPADPRIIGRVGGGNNMGLNPHLEGGRSARTMAEGEGIFRNSADQFGKGFNIYDLLNETQYHARKNENGGYIPQAENGIEGTMGGLTDQGFDYNGAWGGPSMQMGGSMPGAVGFTYARTAGAAPSNGPYAKKTKASAQNGKEMSFYQNGLDWTPRNISKQGSKIKKDDNGYWNPENWGEPVEIGSNDITMRGLQEMGYNKPLLGVSDTGDTQMMYPGEDYTFDGESVTEYPIAQNGKKVKVSMSDFKKMGNSYKDSVNTYDYNQALWDAVRSQKSSEVDEAISQNKNLIRNTSNIKPTSYDNVTVGGKNYRIPNYQYPQMDPWETYEPVEGWWERAQSSLNSVNNAINKTSIGKQLMKVNDKIDETLKDVWHKFTSDDKTNNVINKGAEVFTNKQPVSKPTPKPVAKKETPDRFGLTKEDYIEAHKSKPVLTPGNKKGDAYYELKKNGEIYKVYTKSGGNNWVDLPEREFNKPYPIINKTPVKPKSKKEEPAKPQPKPQETKKPEPRPQNVYEGSPVYSPGAGTGMGSALVGFANQKGDTTYIKPEDYERFAVPKYGKEFIESKKKKNGGWLEKYN